ncbi:YetF domain-containing protein [Enterococcus faecalis]
MKVEFSFVRSLVEGNSIELYANNKQNKQGFLKAKLYAGDFIKLLINQRITSIEDLNNVRIEANGQL